MASLEDELADLIATEETTLIKGKNLFSWILPDTPDEAVNVRLTGGSSSMEAEISDVAFQITARGKRGDPATPENNLKLIFDALASQKQDIPGGGRTAFTTTSFFWRGFRALSVPQTIAIDDKERPVWVLNLETFVTEL